MARTRRSRGERAGLTREAVLDAALALVDREGMGALSMRRLGAELDVEAMTLYHHVSNKDELLDGIVERVMPAGEWPTGERPVGVLPDGEPPDGVLPDGELPDAEWREVLAGFARSLRDALLRHRAVLPLVLSRPAVTRRNLRELESGVALLCGAGFSPRQALDVVHSVIGFVVAHCAVAATDEPGGDPAQELADVEPEDYPLLAAAARAERGAGGDARFEFTLTAMLAGFADAVGTSAD